MQNEKLEPIAVTVLTGMLNRINAGYAESNCVSRLEFIRYLLDCGLEQWEREQPE